LVVVDFFATWCGPCKRIAPMLDDMSNVETSVTFLKVDVDEVEDVAKAENIEAMPTFLFYKKNAKVGEVVGAAIDKIKDIVQKNK